MTRCKIKRRSDNPVCRKSMFLKQTSNSLPLSPCPLSPGKGYITGATAPDQARMLAVSRTKPLHDAVAQMADDLYGGYAPKQGCFGCLPKVLHDAKPTEQAISDTHIFRKYKGLSTVCGQRISFVLFCSIHQINSLCQ